MSIGESYAKLILDLRGIYDERQAANIADWVFESVTTLKKVDRILNKFNTLNPVQQNLLDDYTHQLLQHKPVQYVLKEVWFARMKLYVDEAVLIPRPETEELVDWIVEGSQNAKCKMKNAKFSLLDIGTGSGCIPLALKKNLGDANVSGLDVSEEALQVARKNASTHNLDIAFHQLNFLNRDTWNQLDQFDIIVSNPPYIKHSEEKSMQQNVLLHEPHIALFVPDEDALIFYKALAKFASTHLKEQGSLFVEINESLGAEVVDLFEKNGFKNIQLKKDLQGKDRMVKACNY